MPATRRRPRTGWRQRKAFLEAYIAANGYICPGLGRPAHPSVRLEVDHIVPVVLGGARLVAGLGGDRGSGE